MFAIAFDLLWHVTRQTHPRGVTQAYADIGNVLNRHGFQRVQGVFTCHRMKVWSA
jgi:virulence-associated protein VapD